MDLTTVIGITSGIILVLLSVFVRGGMIGMVAFIDFPSMIITFGGTFSALLVNYPLHQVINAFKVVKKVFSEPQEDPASYIEQFRHLIIKSSKEGVLALQDEMKIIENEFLRKGVKLIVDGQSYIQFLFKFQLLLL